MDVKPNYLRIFRILLPTLFLGGILFLLRSSILSFLTGGLTPRQMLFQTFLGAVITLGTAFVLLRKAKTALPADSPVQGPLRLLFWVLVAICSEVYAFMKIAT
jgi:hypothetical protein